MKYKIIERAAFQVIGVKREYPMVDGGNMGISTFWNEVNKKWNSRFIISIKQWTNEKCIRCSC